MAQPRRGDPARGDEPGALRLARPVVREPGRRRHPHRRHREQRQGDLRRLQRAGARSRPTSCSTSSASSATTSATTRSPGARWTTCSSTSRGASGRDLRLAAFVSATGSAGTIAAGDRLKDDVRHADRRRRGARVPDDARERLRRAQHPGHRRQAHPADPQRDEHRRRRRRSATAPPTSSTCCSTPPPAARYLADRKGVAGRRHRRARATSGSRRCATCSPRSRRPSCSASAPTTPIVTVATDGGAMYPSERAKTLAARFGGEFDDRRRGRGVRRAPRRRRHRRT